MRRIRCCSPSPPWFLAKVFIVNGLTCYLFCKVFINHQLHPLSLAVRHSMTASGEALLCQVKSINFVKITGSGRIGCGARGSGSKATTTTGNRRDDGELIRCGDGGGVAGRKIADVLVI